MKSIVIALLLLTALAAADKPAFKGYSSQKEAADDAAALKTMVSS